MWATGTTHMIARLTGSTLFANHNLVSIFAFDQRSLTTTSDKSSSPNVEKSWHIISKMRDLRARSPYALFIKDNYGEISAKYPNLKMVDISKKAAEAWKSLSDDKKQSYVKQSQDQKVNYEQEKKRLSPNDLQTVDAAEKARKIERRVKNSIQQLPSKRPRSAFVHFLSTLDRGQADLKEFMQGASQRWSQLTVDDKQKFEDLHQEEKQKYVKALVAWASSNTQQSSPKPPRSASAASAKTVTAKKTRGTTATRKKRATSVAKSTKTKSAKAASDKESSSSSSDDDKSPKKKILSKAMDSKNT